MSERTDELLHAIAVYLYVLASNSIAVAGQDGTLDGGQVARSIEWLHQTQSVIFDVSDTTQPTFKDDARER